MMLSCCGPNQAFMKCWLTALRSHGMKSYSPLGGNWGFSSATWFQWKSLPLVAIPSVHECACDHLYWLIYSSVWGILGNSMCDKRVHYQMKGLSHAGSATPACVLLFQFIFTVLIMLPLRSGIYHSQGFQKCHIFMFCTGYLCRD